MQHIKFTEAGVQLMQGSLLLAKLTHQAYSQTMNCYYYKYTTINQSQITTVTDKKVAIIYWEILCINQHVYCTSTLKQLTKHQTSAQSLI